MALKTCVQINQGSKDEGHLEQREFQRPPSEGLKTLISCVMAEGHSTQGSVGRISSALAWQKLAMCPHDTTGRSEHQGTLARLERSTCQMQDAASISRDGR